MLIVPEQIRHVPKLDICGVFHFQYSMSMLYAFIAVVSVDMCILETEIPSKNGVKYLLTEYLNPARFSSKGRNVAH